MATAKTSTKTKNFNSVSLRLDNNFTISGRLGADAQVYGKDGSAANLTVYDSTKKAIHVKSFQANVFPSLVKGKEVTIVGYIAPNAYEKDGEKIYTQDLVATSIKLGADSKRAEAEA